MMNHLLNPVFYFYETRIHSSWRGLYDTTPIHHVRQYRNTSKLGCPNLCGVTGPYHLDGVGSAQIW